MEIIIALAFFALLYVAHVIAEHYNFSEKKTIATTMVYCVVFAVVTGLLLRI